MKLVLALAALVVLAACAEAVRPPCACGFDYDPVCGRNGVTYGNQCEAICNARHMTMPTTPGACPPPPCTCPAIDDPVCGMDGTKYPNSCEAECAGVTEYCECPI